MPVRRRRSPQPPDSPLPRRWQQLTAEQPGIASAYDALRAACDEAGPLDARTLALVKLAVSVGAGTSRTVHQHAKKALSRGIEPAALRHVALTALPTIGLPRGLDALAWIEESVAEAAVTPGRVRA